MADSFVAVAGHQREAVLTVLLAVPLLTGALAAAASASAVARAGLRKATVVGASAHLVAGVAVIATPVAMLAMLGLISGDARAVLMAPMVVLIYYGPFLVAALAAQTIVGVVATLLFWFLEGRGSRPSDDAGHQVVGVRLRDLEADEAARRRGAVVDDHPAVDLGRLRGQAARSSRSLSGWVPSTSTSTRSPTRRRLRRVAILFCSDISVPLAALLDAPAAPGPAGRTTSSPPRRRT